MAAVTNPRDQALLDEFIDQLWLEDGLARNTLEAYRRDLAHFAQWLHAARPPQSLTGADEASLNRYLAVRHAKNGIRAATQARLLASFRRFYAFALRRAAVEIDPTVQIVRPKLPARFPKT